MARSKPIATAAWIGLLLLAVWVVYALRGAGEPAFGTVNVASRPGHVTFTLELRDADGRRVRRVPRRSPGPRVRVFDSAGEEVYACTLSYG